MTEKMYRVSLKKTLHSLCIRFKYREFDLNYTDKSLQKDKDPDKHRLHTLQHRENHVNPGAIGQQKNEFILIIYRI